MTRRGGRKVKKTCGYHKRMKMGYCIGCLECRNPMKPPKKSRVVRAWAIYLRNEFVDASFLHSAVFDRFNHLKVVNKVKGLKMVEVEIRPIRKRGKKS